jgi:hypothetical protein
MRITLDSYVEELSRKLSDLEILDLLAGGYSECRRVITAKAAYIEAVKKHLQFKSMFMEIFSRQYEMA